MQDMNKSLLVLENWRAQKFNTSISFSLCSRRPPEFSSLARSLHVVGARWFIIEYVKFCLFPALPVHSSSPGLKVPALVLSPLLLLEFPAEYLTISKCFLGQCWLMAVSLRSRFERRGRLENRRKLSGFTYPHLEVSEPAPYGPILKQTPGWPS
jgi:hypothetical protein